MKKFTLLSAFFAVFMLVAVYATAQDSEMRTWTDTKGNAMKAELVEFTNGVAVLRNAKGKTTRIKIAQLSQTDQDFLDAADAPATDEPAGKQPYEVLGISIIKPTPGQEGGFHDGTTITLLVRSLDLAIVTVDEEASRVTTFVDEKKNDLLDPEYKGKYVARRQDIGDGRKWVTINFRVPNTPATGCKTVTLKAEIVLKVGGGSVVEEHKNIPLSGKGKFKIGKTTVTVKKGEASRSGIENLFSGIFNMEKPEDAKDKKSTPIILETNGSFDIIKKFTFLNDKGEEIESRWSGSSCSNMMEHHEEHYYTLAEEVESVTIKTDAYEKLETLRIPVSVDVGVGF